MDINGQIYRQFFDRCPGLLCVASVDGRFKAVNEAWQKLLHFDEAYLTSRPYFDLIHPDDQQRTVMEARKIKKGQLCANFENRYLTREQHIRWLSWTAAREIGEDFVFATATDITFRKTFEQCLSDNLTRLQEVLDQLKVSIWMADCHGRRAPFSKNWYEISEALPSPRRLADDFLQDIHPEDKERYARDFEHGFLEQRPILQQYRMKGGKEKETLMIDKGIPWYGPEGEFSGYIGVCVEIASPKAASEETLDRLLEELKTLPLRHHA